MLLSLFLHVWKAILLCISSSASTHGSGVGQVPLEEDENEQGIIIEFNPDHIISYSVFTF
jgi:hypothetical protein